MRGYRPHFSHKAAMEFFMSEAARKLDIAGEYKKMKLAGRDLLWHTVGESRQSYLELQDVVKIGGESIVLLVLDKICQRVSIFKIAKGSANYKGKRAVSEYSERINDFNVEFFNVIRERFLRGGAQLQSALHQVVSESLGYIPEIYHAGYRPYCFLEMEFLPGIDPLAWLLRAKDFSKQFDLFFRLVLLVNELHKWKIIHRDLKPNNLKVCCEDQHGFGRIGLLDLTVAKQMTEQNKEAEDLTRANCQEFSITSRFFSSPKMRFGKAADADFQDDIFSLGRIMWCFFSRKIPKISEEERAQSFLSIDKTPDRGLPVRVLEWYRDSLFS